MRSILKVQTYKSIAEHSYEALRGEIVKGKLRPGDTLIPREIAARLGCSPMPVRDAITRLATEGFVTVSPRKVTQVARFSIREMNELFSVRTVVEAYAAELACNALTDSDLCKLTGLIDSMTGRLRANDLNGWFRLNQHFHFLVFDRANNTTLRRILIDLWDKTVRSRAKVLLNRPEFVGQRMAEHQAILEAFRRRDADAVRELWREHIAHSGEEARAFFAAAQGAEIEHSPDGRSRRIVRLPE